MTTARTYILSSLVLVCVSSVAALLSFVGWPAGMLRGGTGLVFVWFAPGYVLLFALFARSLERTWHIILSLPTSIVVIILIDAVLALWQAGLADRFFIWSLWSFIVGLTLVGLVRLRITNTPAHSHTQDSLAVHEHHQPGMHNYNPSSSYRSAAIGGRIALVLLLCATLWWSITGIHAAFEVIPTPFTTLAVSHVSSNKLPQLVVENHEGKPMNYRLEYWIDGHLTQRWTVDTLAPDDQWRTNVPAVLEDSRVEVKLFRAGDAAPYRTVHVALQAR